MLVVINLDISCCLLRVVNKDDGEFMDEGTSLIQWPLPFTDDQSITFDVHYMSLTYTALTGAISLTNKTISDGGITVDFSIIKVPTSN